MVRYGTGTSCINLLIFIGKMLNVLILISYHISHIVPIKYQRVFYYSNSDPIGIWAGITPPLPPPACHKKATRHGGPWQKPWSPVPAGVVHNRDTLLLKGSFNSNIWWCLHEGNILEWDLRLYTMIINQSNSVTGIYFWYDMD